MDFVNIKQVSLIKQSLGEIDIDYFCRNIAIHTGVQPYVECLNLPIMGLPVSFYGYVPTKEKPDFSFIAMDGSGLTGLFCFRAESTGFSAFMKAYVKQHGDLSRHDDREGWDVEKLLQMVLSYYLWKGRYVELDDFFERKLSKLYLPVMEAVSQMRRK